MHGHHPPLPVRLRPARALALWAGLLLLAAACGASRGEGCGPEFGSGEPASGSIEPGMLELRVVGLGGEPTAIIALGGIEQEGRPGNLSFRCRTDDGGFVEGFSDAVQQVPAGHLEVPPDTAIGLVSDAGQVHAWVGTIEEGAGDPVFEPLQELDLSEGRDTIALGAGRYALQVTASWPQGQADFTFGIRVA